MHEWLIPLVIVGNGLAAGVMLSTVMGIVPMTFVMSYERYVRTIQFLWPRYDPFMPIVNALSAIGGLVLAAGAPEPTSRALFGAAAVTLIVVMAISVIKNVPINRYVMSLDPEACPDDWEHRDPRARWRNWNLFRTSLVLVALSMNALAAGLLL